MKMPNPSTNFELNILQSGYVSVKIFDLSGNIVEVLINDFYSAGSHMITWNANNAASGFYILNTELNDKSISQRITLIK